jgi:hypothetical protein
MKLGSYDTQHCSSAGNGFESFDISYDDRAFGLWASTSPKAEKLEKLLMEFCFFFFLALLGTLEPTVQYQLNLLRIWFDHYEI